ncbi:MAG: transglycosylase domain-containing protein [Bradyrhizobium sp.]|uniref:transglycosylase domain-containing protein n=1 Tax=Bradyrhizobium sp. TaxID=376 RepID=UPI0025C09B58|nr:transglycosylase domain-containing protein [Bradyrhizobium sp.]MBI5261928.1 transglycosylase domain-containing protein [Bradyrhizobium sp.]
MQNVFVVIGKSVLALLSVAGTALLVFTGWFVWHSEYDLGLPDESKLAALSSTERVCSAGGQRLYTPLAEIPPLVRKAVLAYEDPDFYERPHVNPLAAVVLAAHANRRPWSYISVSVTYCLMRLSSECCRGLDRHLGNLILMGRIERVLSRDRILEIYLNERYFGRDAYGVSAAAEAYFGRPLGELGIEETAFIVSLPRHPYRHHDAGPRDVVLDRMLKAGLINEAQALSAKSQPLYIKPLSRPGNSDSL